MPTQLKIIANNITPYAPFTVNFATPVVIEPGNKITMDKFMAVIPDITSNFALPLSTFTLYIALDGLMESRAMFQICFLCCLINIIFIEMLG